MQTQFERITDNQWQVMSTLLDITRKRKHCLRNIFDAIMYITRTGVQWRNLPDNFPPWDTVYYYFDKYGKDGTFKEISNLLNKTERLIEGMASTPSLLIVDSQSIKLAPMIFEQRGIDGNKKVNGRKRQIMVDKMGRLYEAEVHAANIYDGNGGLELLNFDSTNYPRLEKIMTDGTYRGEFAEAVAEIGLKFEIPVHEEKKKGFVVEAKRWVVERSFAWLNFFRRVVIDYEHTPRSAVSFLFLANISMVKLKIPEIAT